NALAPGHRPRGHRDAEHRREVAGERGKDTLRPRPRRIHRPNDGVRRRHGRRDPRTVAIDRRVVRLVAHCVHSVAGAVGRGARSVRTAARAGTHLPRSSRDPLVPALSHIRYAIVGEPGKWLTVATTRPETMLGDVALAVNPDDERYASLIGRTVILPIAGIEIPIIADAYADPAFGTGVVKITPAHDPNDFEVGKRHALPMPVIMTAEGNIDNVADAEGRVPPDLRGVERF